MNSFSPHHDRHERIDGLPFHRMADRLDDALQEEFDRADDHSDDHSDDHNAESSLDDLMLAKRVAECDAVLESVLQEVDVPAGLSDRLKHSLMNTRARSILSVEQAVSAKDAASADDAGTADVTPAKRSRSQTGRREKPHRYRAWMGWVAASLVVSLLATGATIAYVVMQQQPTVVSRDHLAHESMEWKLAVDQREWTPGLPPQRDAYPVSQDVLTRPQQWMTLDTVYDPQTVVYDLTPPGQKQVLQFTLRTSRQFNLDPVLPAEPIYETGSFCIGASYGEGVLYVVFVEGNARRYRDVIWEVGPAG